MRRVLALLTLGAAMALAPAAALADENGQGYPAGAVSTPDVATTMVTTGNTDQAPQLNTGDNTPVYLQQNQ